MMRWLLTGIACCVTTTQVMSQTTCPYLEDAIIPNTGQPTTTWALGNVFGYTVDYSGGTLVVGDWAAGANGAAYVYERDSSGNWVQTAQLTPSTSALDDFYGYSVAIGTDRIVVGSPLADGANPTEGAIFLFDRQPDGSWLETVRATGSDTTTFDDFGYAVAISEDDLTVIVGAPRSDVGTQQSNEGAVYVFEFDTVSGTWSETQLIASNASNELEFGGSVAIDNDVLAVGSYTLQGTTNPGAAYVYERQQLGVWAELNILLPSGQRSDFSRSLDISGNTIIAGNQSDDAYVFEDQGAGWAETQRIPMSKLTLAVAIEDDQLALCTNDLTTYVIEVYNRPGGAGSSWSKSFELQPSDSVSSVRQSAVVFADNDIIVGSGDLDSVYAFTNRQGQFWVCPTRPSAGLGDTITYFINAGQSLAGAGYWILGSVSGTEPGFDLLGSQIPLNIDPYLTVTLNSAATPITNATGSLDSNGQATAQLVLPTDPTLAETVAHHAYVIFNPQTLTIVDVSEPIPITVVP